MILTGALHVPGRFTWALSQEIIYPLMKGRCLSNSRLVDGIGIGLMLLTPLIKISTKIAESYGRQQSYPIIMM
jgi:hypothetical protein